MEKRIVSSPSGIQAHRGAAEAVVCALPWQVGRTADQRRVARGRAAVLTNHIAGLLASGWTVAQVCDGLNGAPGATTAPDAPAQEKLWRSALKRAKNARDRATAAPLE
jgi:hypothetical protein